MASLNASLFRIESRVEEGTLDGIEDFHQFVVLSLKIRVRQHSAGVPVFQPLSNSQNDLAACLYHRCPTSSKKGRFSRSGPFV